MGDRMTFKNKGNTTPGYLARPTQAGPKASHAFSSNDRSEVPAAAAAADAWVEALGFFRGELQG